MPRGFWQLYGRVLIYLIGLVAAISMLMSALVGLARLSLWLSTWLHPDVAIAVVLFAVLAVLAAGASYYMTKETD